MKKAAPSTTKHPRRARRWVSRALGILGEVLVTLGVLLALFVVWEVWWTDVVGTRQQQEAVDDLTWRYPPIPDGGFPVILPTEEPDDFGIPIIEEKDKHRTDSPPFEPTPETAETFATMYVPRWGADYVKPISEGVGRRDVLDKLGIGHYPETALPGGWGNFAVAGHRTTYGKPFSRIEELVEGDAIIVRTESTWYLYRVTETKIVYPGYTAAIAPVPGRRGVAADGRYVTLTTCHPRFSASKRYIVHGILEYWAEASAGYPEEIVFNAQESLSEVEAGVGEGP